MCGDRRICWSRRPACRCFGYRAPSYSVTSRSLWALDVLIEEGFRYDASIFPIHHDRYGIPTSPRHPYLLQREYALLEAPGSTVQWGPFNLPVAGGGYFRILPYAWTRWGISRLNQVERAPAIFYLHPWEIDPDQPRLPAPLAWPIPPLPQSLEDRVAPARAARRLPVFDHGLRARARRVTLLDNDASAAAVRVVAPTRRDACTPRLPRSPSLPARTRRFRPPLTPSLSTSASPELWDEFARHTPERAAITCGAGATSSKRRSATKRFTCRPRTPARSSASCRS